MTADHDTPDLDALERRVRDTICETTSLRGGQMYTRDEGRILEADFDALLRAARERDKLRARLVEEHEGNTAREEARLWERRAGEKETEAYLAIEDVKRLRAALQAESLKLGEAVARLSAALMDCGELRVRAEKAEARVKELEEGMKRIVTMYGAHADCSKLAARALGWTTADAVSAVKEVRAQESERVRAALAQEKPHL